MKTDNVLKGVWGRKRYVKAREEITRIMKKDLGNYSQADICRAMGFTVGVLCWARSEIKKHGRTSSKFGKAFWDMVEEGIVVESFRPHKYPRYIYRFALHPEEDTQMKIPEDAADVIITNKYLNESAIKNVEAALTAYTDRLMREVTQAVKTQYEKELMELRHEVRRLKGQIVLLEGEKESSSVRKYLGFNDTTNS